MYEEDVLPTKKSETGGQSDKRTFLFPAFPVDGLPGTGVSLSKHINSLPEFNGDALPDICGGSISPMDASVLARCVAVGQETEKADWLAEIEIVAAEARLSERSLKRIKKAKNVVVEMVATIVFFHLTIQRKIKALSLPPAIEMIMFEKLIPAFYLRLASNKAKAADNRHRHQKNLRKYFLLSGACKIHFSGLPWKN